MGVSKFPWRRKGATNQAGGEFAPGVVRCRLRAPYSCPVLIGIVVPKEESGCELEMSARGQVRLTGLLFRSVCCER